MSRTTGFTTDDHRWMQRAMALARRGEGRVEPNPMVGCVLVRDGVVLGEGWHRAFGRPHAEVEALRACVVDPRGATAYVTLEPCCHFGKTPPCVGALIDAGIARVVLPFLDPHPLVSGGGAAALKKAGIRVQTGLLRDAAANLLAPFLTRVRFGRPYVIAKWAQSLDAKLATRSRASRWISGEESRRLIHRLRARVDAVLIGSNTLLRDNPLLTAREVPLRRVAARIVLDARLRTPETCQLVKTAADASVIVFTSRTAADSPKAKRLRRRGVEVFSLPFRSGRWSWSTLGAVLADRGMTNVLIEGGAAVLESAFAAGVVDEAWVFVAAKWLGGGGAPSIRFPSVARPDQSAPHSVELRAVGRDAWFRCRLRDPRSLLARPSR